MASRRSNTATQTETTTETPAAETATATETPAPQTDEKQDEKVQPPAYNKGKVMVPQTVFASSVNEAFENLVKEIGEANYDPEYIRVSVKRGESGNKVSMRLLDQHERELRFNAEL